MATGCAASPWAFGAEPQSPNTAASDLAAGSWTIGNDRIQRTLAFEPKAGLFTTRLSDLSTGVDFILPGEIPAGMAQEFSFLCNGQLATGINAAFDLIGVSQSALPAGKSLLIRLHHKSLALEVAVVYSVYDGHPAIRKRLALRNTGTSPLHLSHLNIESIAVSVGPENETTLLAQYGAIPREIFYTGRSEDAGLLISNGRTGAGIAILSEVPGYMKRTEIGGWDDPHLVRIGVLYDTDLMPFERTLKGGEEFSTAGVSLLSFRNHDGFHDPHWLLPSSATKPWKL